MCDCKLTRGRVFYSEVIQLALQKARILGEEGTSVLCIGNLLIHQVLNPTRSRYMSFTLFI